MTAEHKMKIRPVMSDARWLRLSVASIPIFTVALVVALKVTVPNFYRLLIAEDGPVENATVIAYGAAAVLAAGLFISLRSQQQKIIAFLYLALAAGLLFIAMEELNWGQRLVGFSTPNFFVEHGTKPEFSLHNLKAVPLGYLFILVGFFGAFSRLILKKPLAGRYPMVLALLTPRVAWSGFFLVPLLLYIYYEYVYQTVMLPLGIEIRREYKWEGHFITGKDQEPIELLLAIGFLVFLLDNWRNYRTIRWSSGSR